MKTVRENRACGKTVWENRVKKPCEETVYKNPFTAEHAPQVQEPVGIEKKVERAQQDQKR